MEKAEEIFGDSNKDQVVATEQPFSESTTTHVLYETQTLNASIPAAPPAPPVTGATSGLKSPRRLLGDQKVESMYRVFKQSIAEAIGSDNWKVLFGQELMHTTNPQIEACLKRLDEIHRTYSEMGKSLEQYAGAWKALASAECSLSKLFSEVGLKENDDSIRSPMLQFSESHKGFQKTANDLSLGYQGFADHVNTYFHKAIEDCSETARKLEHSRLEYDGFMAKQTHLQSKYATEPQKFQRELDLSRSQTETARNQYLGFCEQLTAKVEILYDLKIQNLKEQINSMYKLTHQHLSDGARPFEMMMTDMA